MNVHTLASLKVINLDAQQQDREVVTKNVHSELIRFSPGSVVCITDPTPPKNGRVINRIHNLLQRNNSKNNCRSMPVIKISAGKSIKQGLISSKELTLEVLKIISPKLFVGRKGQRTPEVTLQIALERSLISRRTEYLLITNTHRVLSDGPQEISSLNILDKWSFLAKAAGVIIIFDLMTNPFSELSNYDNKGE